MADIEADDWGVPTTVGEALNPWMTLKVGDTFDLTLGGDGTVTWLVGEVVSDIPPCTGCGVRFVPGGLVLMDMEDPFDQHWHLSCFFLPDTGPYFVTNVVRA
jgi:hypothetical protein